MKKLLVSALTVLLVPLSIPAHLCNDVFRQAKDNLAVKVDIRDGQLRISKSGQFRVYLLNTMDRGIDNINLEVVTDDFNVQVSPSPTWYSFPSLRSKNNGGEKQYFEVNLTRKSNTQQGKYKISLRLIDGGDRDRVFKTVDINEAFIESMEVPQKPATLAIDGKIERTEWENALLCTSLYAYKYTRDYYANVNPDFQTRFRFLHDYKNLYCLVDFQTKSRNDIAWIYVARNNEDIPTTIEIDLNKKIIKIVGVNDPAIKTQTAFNDTKVEIALPLEILKLAAQNSFYINVARKQNDTVTYWRGNSISVMNPLIFANFLL